MGRQSKARAQRLAKKNAIPTNRNYRPYEQNIGQKISQGSSVNRESSSMKLEDIKLTEYQKEVFPCFPSIFYKELPSDMVKSACIEYIFVHDYGWIRYSYAKLKFTPTTASNYFKKDYPGDMASAMSLKVFADFYKNIEELSEYECERKIEKWCMVVCSLGKAMQKIYEWYPHIVSKYTYEEVLDFIIKYMGLVEEINEN